VPSLSSGHTSIKELQEIAHSKGGECLSTDYKDAHHNLKWKCSRGHIWEAAAHSVKYRGSWCKKCYYLDQAGSSQRLKLEDIRLLAPKNNGILLSNEYKNNHHKLKWQCENGHVFLMSASDVTQSVIKFQQLRI
jgi:hypothetical protein